MNRRAFDKISTKYQMALMVTELQYYTTIPVAIGAAETNYAVHCSRAANVYCKLVVGCSEQSRMLVFHNKEATPNDCL